MSRYQLDKPARRKVTGAMPEIRLGAPEVHIVCPSYQPSKAELEEDVRVNATFEEAVQALTLPVRIRYVPRPPKHSG